MARATCRARLQRRSRGGVAVDPTGYSIEDFNGGELYPRTLASDRVRAAAEANCSSDSPLELTARAANHIRGNPDLADTIARLQSSQEAGAAVLYAPGLMTSDYIRSVASAVDLPINVLIMPGGPGVPEIFAAGGTLTSTGSAISVAAQAALINAARELLDDGTHPFWLTALQHAGAIKQALSGKG